MRQNSIQNVSVSYNANLIFKTSNETEKVRTSLGVRAARLTPVMIDRKASRAR